MAVTELLVLVTLLSHLTCCAHAFCWKPNLNPFMGTSHLKTLDNNIWFQHWIKSQRCPGYGTGRLVNCAGQLGRRLPKGGCLWRGFSLRKSWWQPLSSLPKSRLTFSSSLIPSMRRPTTNSQTSHSRSCPPHFLRRRKSALSEPDVAPWWYYY